MRNRVQGDPAEQVGGVVALVERRGGVGVLVRGQREHEHRKGEDELADLGVQVAVLWVERAEGYTVRTGEVKAAPRLTLRDVLAYVFGLMLPGQLPGPSLTLSRGRRAPNQVRQEAHASVRARTKRQPRPAQRAAHRAQEGARRRRRRGEAGYAEAVTLLDRAGRKRIIHPNAAARQKSRLAKLVSGKK